MDASAHSRHGRSHVSSGEGKRTSETKSIVVVPVRRVVPVAVSGAGILGRIYWNGEGVPVKHEHAFELFSKGVEHNDVLSMWALGQMYFDGNYVDQDYRRAREYWYRATDTCLMKNHHSSCTTTLPC